MIALALIVAGLAPAPAAIDDPAVAEVRRLIEGQQADWNRGDLDGFLKGYWDDPALVFQSGGDRTRGLSGVRDRYRKRYQDEGRAMGQLTFSDLEIEPLGPNSALARGRWGLVMPDGSKPGGLFTLVLRRLDGAWKIVHDHTSTGM